MNNPLEQGQNAVAVVNQLNQINQILSKIQQTLGNSYIALAADNTFTGTNTFKKPPLINAGIGGSGTFKPQGNISVQVPPGGVGNTNDTTEDTLFTYTIPAGSFDIVGRAVSFLAFGILANNGHTKTTRAYFGSSIVYSSGGLTNANVSWFISGSVYKSASNAQVGVFQGQFGASVIAPSFVSGTETDINAISIKVTGQTGTAAANDIVANGMIIGFAD